MVERQTQICPALNFMRIKEMAQSADGNSSSPNEEEEEERQRRYKRYDKLKQKQDEQIAKTNRNEPRYRHLIVPMRENFVALHQEVTGDPCDPIIQVMVQAGIEHGLALRTHVELYLIADEILQSDDTNIRNIDFCKVTRISRGYFYETMRPFYPTIKEMMAEKGIIKVGKDPVKVKKTNFYKYIVGYLVGDLSVNLGITCRDADSDRQPTKPPNNPAGGGDGMYVELTNSQAPLPTDTDDCEADNSKLSAAISPDPDIDSGSE